MNEAEARLRSFADFERKGLLSGKVEPNFFAIAQDLRVVLDELARVRESVTRISEEHGFLILKHESTCAERDKLRAELEVARRDLSLLRNSWNAQQESIREADRQLRELADLVDLDVIASWKVRNGWQSPASEGGSND